MRLVSSWPASWRTPCDADPVSSFRTGKKLAAEYWVLEAARGLTNGDKRELEGHMTNRSSSKACCCNTGKSRTSCKLVKRRQTTKSTDLWSCSHNCGFDITWQVRLALGQDTCVCAFWPWARSGKHVSALKQTHRHVLDMLAQVLCLENTKSSSQCTYTVKLLTAEPAFELMPLLLAESAQSLSELTA